MKAKTRMQRTAWRLFALMLPLFGTSCISLSEWDIKTLKGDFSGIISDFERQGGYEALVQQGASGYYPFYQVCNARFELRERASYDECVERLMPLIPDRVNEWYNDHDHKAFLLAQQAQLRLELADTDAALTMANHAEEELALGDSPSLQGPPHMNVVYYVLKVVGIANALVGNQARSVKVAADLANTTYENTTGWRASAFKTDEHLQGEFESRQDAVTAIYIALGDYEAAATVLDAERELEPSFDRTMSQVSNALDNLFSLGLMNVVETSIEEYYADYENYHQIPKHFRRAKVLYELGRTTEARSLYDQLLGTAATRDFTGIYYAVLHDRGRIARDAGDIGLAIDYFKRAIDDIERQRSSVHSEAGKIGFVGNKQAVYRDLVDALVGSGEVEQAFEYAERSKARALVDLLASKQHFGDQKSTRRVMADSAIVQLGQSDARRSRPQTPYEFELRKSGERGIDISDRGVEISDRELASLIAVDAVALRDISGRLAADETLLEYYGDGGDLMVFVVAEGGISVRRLDGEAISRIVGPYRQVLQNPNDNRHEALSERLHAMLIAPVDELIVGRTLTIVPHGVLHYLPFASLSAEGTPLVERHSIRMLPSASVLTFLDREGSATDSLLTLGNPNLGDARLDLPYAELEAVNVAQLERNSTLLLREDATETAVKQIGYRYARLHFASHGVLDSEEPLASSLLLAPDDENDGYLTVSELYEMELDADLVTLSACETALGEIASGDDVVGLTRGFLFAGSRAIVASLWQVDDQATSDLMQSFYRRLGDGAAPHDALRMAQLDLRSQGKLHPYYWAPFQITGDTRM